VIPSTQEETTDFVYVSPKYVPTMQKSSMTPEESENEAKGNSHKEQDSELISQSENSLKRKRVTEASDIRPIRQYFHSKNLVPMQPHEWNEDSDDESDEMWMHTISDEVMIGAVYFIKHVSLFFILTPILLI